MSCKSGPFRTDSALKHVSQQCTANVGFINLQVCLIQTGKVVPMEMYHLFYKDMDFGLLVMLVITMGFVAVEGEIWIYNNNSKNNTKK